MNRVFTLEYWVDDGWFVGRLREFPAVMSQGKTLDELKENIRDACRMMAEVGSEGVGEDAKTLELTVEV